MYGCNLQISYIFINFETKYHILTNIIKTLILELFSYIMSVLNILHQVCDKQIHLLDLYLNSKISIGRAVVARWHFIMVQFLIITVKPLQ